MTYSRKAFEEYLSLTVSGSLTYPLVPLRLRGPSGQWSEPLPFLFDTGASYVFLPRTRASLIGVSDWQTGERHPIRTATGEVDSYRHPAELRVFGKRVSCPVHLMDMQKHPLYIGLLGRYCVFRNFGFGFWESEQLLYYTRRP